MMAWETSKLQGIIYYVSEKASIYCLIIIGAEGGGGVAQGGSNYYEWTKWRLHTYHPSYTFKISNDTDKISYAPPGFKS